MLKPPGLTHAPLPFAIDETDFSAWLATLDLDDEASSCERILQVLQTLNKTHHALASKTRLFFLNKLGKTLFELADKLTSAAYTIEKAKAYLAIWGCSELANGYILLAEEPRFKADGYYALSEKIQIITFGLQAMSKALLHTSQAYAKPYLYFWIKCYQLYQTAQQEKLTEDTIDPTHIDYPNIQAIDNAFKQILVFSLSNSNQFSPQEMKLVYTLLNDYASDARFLHTVPEKKFSGIPSLNLKNDLPPAIPASTANTALEDEQTLYVATVAIASKILKHLGDKNHPLSQNERALLARLAKTLTLNRHRKHPRERDRSKYFGIIGFDNLVSFFCQQRLEADPEVNVGQPDLEHPGELRALNFEILPHEKTLDYVVANQYNSKSIRQQMRVNPTEVWSRSKKLNYEANATQIDKSLAGYGLIWQDKNTEPRVGDIIGMQNANPSVGFIRWIAQSPTSVLLFGVELLGFNPQAVKIFNAGIPETQIDAIHLVIRNKDEGPIESIIIHNDNFNLAEFIFIHYQNNMDRYRVIKQLHTTPLLRSISITRA